MKANNFIKLRLLKVLDLIHHEKIRVLKQKKLSYSRLHKMYEMIESVYDTITHKPEDMAEKMFPINGSLINENISKTKDVQE
jgi:hypothetical protein